MMKKNIIGAVIFALLMMNAGADIIVSTTGYNRSEIATGVEIRLNSSLPVYNATSNYTLNSFTFQSDGNDSGTYWLNVYQAGSSTEATGFDFSADDTTGLTFLGASASSINHDPLGNGDDVNYTFSGITVAPDRDVFIVFSTTATAGSIVQAGLKSLNTVPTYSNLLAADVEDVNGNDSGEYITFSGDFTEVIPEPATLSMIASAGALLMLLRRRIRK
jgi:hypothetical protein